jgi:hypothetical protein
MPAPDAPNSTTGDPLDAVIADYLQKIEADEVPDRAALLAAHPELADHLRTFFADFDRLDRKAVGLRDVGPDVPALMAVSRQAPPYGLAVERHRRKLNPNNTR